MKTVVFDLDGTLADTSGDLIAAGNKCFVDMGMGALLDPSTDAGTAMRGGMAMLRLGLTRLGREKEAENASALYPGFYPLLIKHYAQDIDTHTTLYLGAMAAVEALKSQGYLVAVCTNKPIMLAELLLKRLGVYDTFGAVLGADSISVRKPDPEHLFETVRQAGGDPDQCVLVGDSATDRNTALNANVPCILVTFGPEGSEMPGLNPEVLLDHYRDLAGVVDQLFGKTQ